MIFSDAGCAVVRPSQDMDQGCLIGFPPRKVEHVQWDGYKLTKIGTTTTQFHHHFNEWYIYLQNWVILKQMLLHYSSTMVRRRVLGMDLLSFSTAIASPLTATLKVWRTAGASAHWYLIQAQNPTNQEIGKWLQSENLQTHD